jgi:hypothetical protein
MSIEAVAKALQDYASQFQHYVRSPWTWHFAGVVARSGGEWVTLENYNRADELEKACLSLAAQVEATYRGQIDRIMSELRDDMNGKSVAEFNTFISGGANYVIDELNTYLQAQVQPAIANFPAASGMWFFQLYGSKKGQSFHEAMAQTGDFVNPLTVRWREPVTAEYVADCKAKLTEKVIELLAAHNREDDKQHLNEVLPQIVEKAKRDIDQATTKPEVTKITKRALTSIESRQTVLSLLH